jgi:hypothetical protein
MRTLKLLGLIHFSKCSNKIRKPKQLSTNCFLEITKGNEALFPPK